MALAVTCTIAAVVVCQPVATALARALPASACAQAPPPGGTTIQVRSGRRTRVALVHVPRGIGARRRVALVLVLHGAGGTGPKMERYSGFSQTADRYGFVAVYPTAAGPVWNHTASPTAADDVAFISALVSRLRRSVCVDSGRIFATGVSNGAGMTALLGCRLDVLRAIAPVEGDYTRQPRCRPSHPVSVLEIHGTADTVAPYFGRGGRPTGNGLPPVVNSWVRIDGCTSQAASKGLASRTTMYSFGGCENGVVVKHIRIQDGAHQWPGARPPDPGPPATICATCRVWRFFSHGVSSGTGGTGGTGSGGVGLPG